MNKTNLSEILNYFQQYSFFLSIWISSLILVITLAIIFKNENSRFFNQDIIKSKNFLSSNIPKNKFFYFQILILGLFVGTYIYLILDKADFAYHDNAQFTLFSLQGKFFGMPISPTSGRYWPLGLQEYNFIGLFSKTPWAYHSFSIFQLLVTIGLCFSIFSKLKLIYKIILTIIILTLPSFVMSFFGLIYPERDLVFWLAIFIFSFEKLEQNKSLIYTFLIFIAAQFLLYYKEPMFILMLGFAVSRLIIISFEQKLWQKKQQEIFIFIKNNWVDFGLIILSLIFVILYISSNYGHVKTSYGSQGSESRSMLLTLYVYLKVNPVLSIFLACFSFRTLGFILGKYSINLFWDSLAFGNIGYFLSYIVMDIPFRFYYPAPIDFIATLYLAKITSSILTDKHYQKFKFLTVIASVSLILFININYSAYSILAVKKQIDARVQTTYFLENYINKTNDNIQLFFPSNSMFDLTEMTGFLFYKNVPIFNNKNQDIDNRLVIMRTNRAFERNPNNLCIPSISRVQCFYAQKPLKNDLIIFIPHDEMLLNPNLYSNSATSLIEKFQQNSEVLFHYKPEFKGLYKLLYFLSKDVIDDNWFNAYIFTPPNSDAEIK